MKEQLSGKVFFGNISIFYDSISKIGSGASSIVFKIKLFNFRFALFNLSQNSRNLQLNVSVKSICYKKKIVNEWFLFVQSLQIIKKRLYQEIQILQIVKHPNLVELIEIYQGESSYYIITELLEGDTLYKFIKGYPADVLPLKMIKLIMRVV